MSDVLHFLVVEDDLLDRKLIKKALVASGIPHEVIFAVDHETGREAALGKEFDIIFLDYNLPGGTGIELLTDIRNSGNISPIYLITSQTEGTLGAEAIKNGATDYIPKNLLSADGISQTIRHAIEIRNKSRKQKELEDALKATQERLNKVVSNSPVILFSFDAEGICRLFEGSIASKLGLDKDQILNQHISQQNNIPVFHDDFCRAIKGEEFTIINQWNNHHFETYYSPIRNGDCIDGVIGVASEITDHINAKEELKKAKTFAEETAKMKEVFLSNMSHEIRTPLNGITGITRILLNTQLSEEQDRYLKSIRFCTDNLLVIINDILDFSKLEAGKMTLEKVPFHLKNIVQHTVELFQFKAEEKSIQLVADMDDFIPEYIKGDPTRLSQILNNLVCNAIKFTEEGQVRIVLRVCNKIENYIIVRFEIKDSGIGIPEKSLNSIFESFTQASTDTTRKYGGTGLGLSIVKRLIELHDGEITVSSREGFGTTFRFELKFEIAEKNTEERTIQDQTDLSSLTALAAEDNKINQLIIRKVFADWKMNLEIADNGEEAIRILSEKKIDIILMDIQMPIMDGYTAVRHIRNSGNDIPILAMTAHATANEKQKCADFGMNDYISKPFNLAELKKKVITLTKAADVSLKYVTSSPKSDKVPLNMSPDNFQHFDIPANGKISPSKDIFENGKKINLKYLKQLSEGNDVFIIEMIEMFLNKTPEALEKLNESFKSGNWSEVKHIAHKIKPSYGYIGMPEVQDALSQIEFLSDDHSEPEKVNQLMAEVIKNSNSAFEQLKEELNGLK